MQGKVEDKDQVKDKLLEVMETQVIWEFNIYKTMVLKKLFRQKLLVTE